MRQSILHETTKEEESDEKEEDTSKSIFATIEKEIVADVVEQVENEIPTV